MRVEHAALGLHRARRDPRQFVGKFDNVLAEGFSLEPDHPRRHRAATLADFAELRGEVGILDPRQRLVLVDDGTFLDQQFADDAAFQRLHHLGLA